jgi:hypothetical protein
LIAVERRLAYIQTLVSNVPADLPSGNDRTETDDEPPAVA